MATSCVASHHRRRHRAPLSDDESTTARRTSAACFRIVNDQASSLSRCLAVSMMQLSRRSKRQTRFSQLVSHLVVPNLKPAVCLSTAPAPLRHGPVNSALTVGQAIRQGAEARREHGWFQCPAGWPPRRAKRPANEDGLDSQRAISGHVRSGTSSV